MIGKAKSRSKNNECRRAQKLFGIFYLPLILLLVKSKLIPRSQEIVSSSHSERAIRWHIAKGRLFATLQERKYLVSKYSLIKFLVSDKGFAMQPKSEWHEKAITWFVKEVCKLK